MRRPSNAARDQVARHEGLRLQAYPDPGTGGEPWTIGYGHTRGVRPGMVITQQQALDFLAEDMLEAVETIYRHVPAHIVDALPQACFDALVSFVFNVGDQAFRNPRTGKPTDFYRAVVGPDPIEVARQMQRWVKAGGRVMPGLVRRRGEEASLWGAGLEAARGARTEAVIEELESAAPDAPTPTPLIQQPGVVAGAAAAGASGVGAAAAMLGSAGTSVAMSGNTVVVVLGIALILVAAVLMIVFARRK